MSKKSPLEMLRTIILEIFSLIIDLVVLKTILFINYEMLSSFLLLIFRNL